MAERRLSDLQKSIVRLIVDRNIEKISYYHPRMQLGTVIENRRYHEVINALRSLESDFRILNLDPKLKFRLVGRLNTRCEYKVSREEAKRLYETLLK